MSSILEMARGGRAILDTLVIDSHCHIGFWHNFYIPNNTAEDMLVSMDSLGTDRAFITAHSSIGPDYNYGNNLVIDAIEKYPERFLGYATVNPNYVESMKHELERCFSFTGIKGIKIHPGTHTLDNSIDNKNYNIAYEKAQERKCPILIHVSGRSAVAAVDKIVLRYPDATFIMGHAGFEVIAMYDALDVVNRHKNVYVDLAISLAYEGNIEWFVKQIGSKKILFGSDMPFFDPRPAFGRIVFAQISDEEKRDILGLNMAKILKM